MHLYVYTVKHMLSWRGCATLRVLQGASSAVAYGTSSLRPSRSQSPGTTCVGGAKGRRRVSAAVEASTGGETRRALTDSPSGSRSEVPLGRGWWTPARRRASQSAPSRYPAGTRRHDHVEEPRRQEPSTAFTRSRDHQSREVENQDVLNTLESSAQ